MPNGVKNRTLPARYEPGFLRAMDRRTEIAQRLLAAYDAVVADAGGEENLTHTKLALIERFVFLEATVQAWEYAIATNPKGTEALVSRWVQAVNSLQGLAKLIGLTRTRKHVMNLREYVEERA
jgi:hypothetical protein